MRRVEQRLVTPLHKFVILVNEARRYEHSKNTNTSERMLIDMTYKTIVDEVKTLYRTRENLGASPQHLELIIEAAIKRLSMLRPWSEGVLLEENFLFDEEHRRYFGKCEIVDRYYVASLNATPHVVMKRELKQITLMLE